MRVRSHTVQAFAIGAASGFLGGAALVAVILSGAPAGPGTGDPTAPATETADGAGDGAGRRDEPAGVTRTPPAPVATSGEPDPVVPPPPSPEPVLDAPPASELADRDLVIPVAGVTRDQLTQSFSEPRGPRRHEAIDIVAPHDTPVLAVESGTIARLFYSEAGGITIYQFDPSERFCYYYAHLDRYSEGLTEGQTVRQGQVLGYVGVTGNAPEGTPHLHFAIFRLSSAKRWWEGTPVDPFGVLR